MCCLAVNSVIDCYIHTISFKTSPPTSSAIPLPPAARRLAQDGGDIDFDAALPSPPSPTLSASSTADGQDDDDDINLSPVPPALPAPKLPGRASAILRPPSDAAAAAAAALSDDKPQPRTKSEPKPKPKPKPAFEFPFGIASWGSPYPRSDDNLAHRRWSLSSDGSQDSPAHQLDIATPFLRPPPVLRQRQSRTQRAPHNNPSPLLQQDQRPESEPEPLSLSLSLSHSLSAVSAAAAVLANRVRRPPRGLTEGWIRSHTAAAEHGEPRHWLSDGSSSNSSEEDSDNGWLCDPDLQTPRPLPRGAAAGAPANLETGAGPKPLSRAAAILRAGARRQHHHHRLRSSVETVKPGDHLIRTETPTARQMAVVDVAPSPLDALLTAGNEISSPVQPDDLADTDPVKRVPSADSADSTASAKAKLQLPLPATPIKMMTDKPLPREPPITPRIRKKVPWKGKNIMILIPRDESRGLPGQPPMPLSHVEVDKMFSSWRELGYSTEGFDLLVEKWPSKETGLPYSRLPWPSPEDLQEEKAAGTYTVVLPDLNAWKNYVLELQEAKLRALGVSFGNEEPEPAPLISSQPSRLPSAQYPPIPFSPPIPTSSASSNHGVPGLPFPHQLPPNGPFKSQSPALPSGASPVPFGAVPGKYPRQSISFPPTHSPFQQPPPPHGWGPAPPGAMHGMMHPHHHDSPSLGGMGMGMGMGPGPNGPPPSQSPYGFDPMQQAGSPAFNIHQRHQSLQYLPPQHHHHHQQQQQHLQPQQHLQQQHMPQQLARASPRLQDVREDEEEEEEHHQEPAATNTNANSTGTLEPAARNADSLQAEIDDAEYHLEEQLRNELEHEDYNPHAQVGPAEHFAANEPGRDLVLHHPRPHSRGHSLSNSFFRDQVHEAPESAGHQQHQQQQQQQQQQFAPLKNIPEARLMDDRCEIETNPSNLGTPVNMDFSAAFHNKTLSTVSNPWQDAVSSNGSARHSSHGSKMSSKFNVDAPVFKFNPTSTFTPGVFNFNNSNSNNSSSGNNVAADADPFTPASSASPPKINAAAPAFAPGQGEFSFSSPSGLKFRPDAPSFTPLGAQTVATPSPIESGSNREVKAAVPRRTNSVSGDIYLDENELSLSLSNKSRAIVRRSSTQSTLPGAYQEDIDSDEFDAFEECRAKRAKSVALDGDEIPLFAKRPEADALETVDEDTIKGTRSEPDDERERARRANDSFSSTASLDQLDTQVTTAAPSETSPAQQKRTLSEPGSQSNLESPSENKRAFGEDSFKPSSSISHDDGELLLTEQPEAAHGQRSATTPPPPPPPVSAAATASARRKLTPKGLSSSRFASAPAKTLGLGDSRFARSPSPIVPAEDDIIESVEREVEVEVEVEHEVEHEVEPADKDDGSPKQHADPEPTFEEIDAVMQHFENDPSMGINKSREAFKWAQSEPAELHSEDLQPLLRDTRSLTPHDYNDDMTDTAQRPLPSTELEDPFLDPPIELKASRRPNQFGDAELDSDVASDDWDGTFPENEHSKLESRAQFFDARVNDLVGDLLTSRLEPLAKTLVSIHDSLAAQGSSSQRGSSARRDLRSASTEYQDSDADDEDDEPPPRRSSSPKRDRRLEQIRLAVTEALAATATQQRSQSAPNLPEPGCGIEESAVLRTLVEIKEQLVTRPIAHDVASQTFTEHSTLSKVDNDWSVKVMGLEQRLQYEQQRLENEIHERRNAEDLTAESNRKLHAAESRLEAEVIKRSVVDKRVADLEDRLRRQEDQIEEETKSRHDAEDRLTEAQRLLRFSSDEETRLIAAVEEKDLRIKALEQSGGDAASKVVTLEDERHEWTRTQSDLTTRVHVLETDLRAARQDVSNWRVEAEREGDAARRKSGELGHTVDDNKRLRKSLDNVIAQLEENERLRESWRGKFLSLQEDMGTAAREVAEENARYIKRDQAMLARQEVLEARLQADAKTRERLEVEMERLQENERAAVRAVNESKRLEEMMEEMRAENAKLQQSVSKYQREIEEAKDAGARETRRARMNLQVDVDAANTQLGLVRGDLEEKNARLRAEVESLRAQTAQMVEDAQTSRHAEIQELRERHRQEMEAAQALSERHRSIAEEDAQRTQRHLRERLDLSVTRTEHLQERIVHLEDKLEITRQAAAAAAQFAKQAGVETSALVTKQAISSLLPEKVSPQALRESIMVLQEQLLAREQRIEELEQTVAGLDPDAASKISKRDDEISWLRELLSVRHGDLQDIITALSKDNVDRVAIKDAAIRLKANLQMEEQERERAMNGGSAITLPNIAQTLQAATPRVAQTIAPIAAAWGNWRKGNTPSLLQVGLSGVLQSASAAGSRAATPSGLRSRASPARSPGPSGLLTPPASGLRQPSPSSDDRPQPTAFSSTGRRFPMAGGSSSSSGLGLERRTTRRDSDASRQSQQTAAGSTTTTTPLQRVDPKEDPMTPPMMQADVYDEDARAEDFDENDFFED